MSSAKQGRIRSVKIEFMFKTILYNPILSVLIFLTSLLGGNFGLAIIALTLLLRAALLPLTMPSLKSAQTIRSLKPELDRLKKRFKDDKMALQKVTLELYKKHNINPAAGCLPNILQIAVLIALYSVFMDALQNGSANLNTQFFWLDLAKPDPKYILPLFAGLIQLALSQMLSPAVEHHHKEKSKKRTEEVADMAETMQQQMLLIMPIMTVLIALRFPSGLALYWVITTLFSLVQQYYISGWGGLEKYLKKFNVIK